MYGIKVRCYLKVYDHIDIGFSMIACDIGFLVNVGKTRTTERGGESVVHKLKQFYAF
jgi:hypothetical protein